MRIAYYIWETFTAGGIQKITIDKVNYLVESGHNVLLMTSYQGTRMPFWAIDPRVEQVDLGIDYTPAYKVSNPLKRVLALRNTRSEHKRRLEKALRAFDADICINTAFCEEGSIFPELKDRSKKILESHGVKYALLPQFKRKGLLSFLGKWMDNRRKARYEEMPKRYDHFVVLSHGHLKQWEGYSNISAIPNMCTLLPPAVSNLESPIVTIAARLSEEKNISSLLRIWRKVLDLGTHWHLNIWGDGPLKEQIQRELRSLNIEQYTSLKGTASDMLTVYNESSIYCLTSSHEGFPMTLMEAQSCGLPIVCYDCPIGPGDIITDGVDGYLIPLHDEDTFAHKLFEVMQNDELRQRMGQEAKAKSERYAPDKVMNEWLDLFHKLLSK